MRIVSLLAGSTEIVCALGLQNLLVGRCHECDYPEYVRELPVCTAPRFKTFGMSPASEPDMETILQESLSLYRLDALLLNELAPSHIFTQIQCKNSSATIADIEKGASKLIKSCPQIFSLQPTCLADICQDIKRTGTALEVESAAEALIARITSGMEAIQTKSATLENRPGIAFIEWIDPLMPGANWLPELIRLAGGRDLFGQEGEPSPVILWKDVIKADPEAMIVAPCGFTLQQSIAEMTLLIEKQGWSDLACVRNNKVYVADGKHFFNRPGPRLLESLQILAEIMHPDIFHFGHENKSWQCYQAPEELE